MERECSRGAPAHFAARVAERIGPHVDGLKLWREVRQAILAGDEGYARFRCNLRQRERAAYRVEIDGQHWFIVADKFTGAPLTVMPRNNVIYSDDFKPKKYRGLPVRQRERKPGPLWIRGRRVK